MPFTTEQSLWRKFLQKYKTFKCLWHKEEINNVEECDKELAWKQLVEIAKNINPEADKAFVQKRINYFRTVCQREKAKSEAAEKAGKQYLPKIFYYDILKSVLDEETDDEVSSSEDVPTASDKANNMNKVVVKQEKIEERNFESTKEQLTEEPATKRARHSPARILARRMAEHLEQMDSDQALIAEKIISDICVYGRLKQLNIDSSIALT